MRYRCLGTRTAVFVIGLWFLAGCGGEGNGSTTTPEKAQAGLDEAKKYEDLVKQHLPDKVERRQFRRH
jgi:hypothetical protein